MTNQEAIKRLTAKAKCLQRDTSGIDVDCNSCNCGSCELCYEQGTMGKQMEALTIAISALEKHIPKEPDMVRNKHNENIWSLYCPSCGNYVGVLNNRLKRVDMYNRSNGNICPYCGQAIDWTEWEGE